MVVSAKIKTKFNCCRSKFETCFSVKHKQHLDRMDLAAMSELHWFLAGPALASVDCIVIFPVFVRLFASLFRALCAVF